MHYASPIKHKITAKFSSFYLTIETRIRHNQIKISNIHQSPKLAIQRHEHLLLEKKPKKAADQESKVES